MLTLTLLDGPLAGRPMPLPQGTLTIGDGDADIAMTLDHDGVVALHVDDQGIGLKSGDEQQRQHLIGFGLAQRAMQLHLASRQRKQKRADEQGPATCVSSRARCHDIHGTNAQSHCIWTNLFTACVVAPATFATNSSATTRSVISRCATRR